MAGELVNMATSDKLKEMDWMKNIEICELVAHDQGQAKYAIKQIKKRLRSKYQSTQVFSVMLLEMLLNNCGEHIHKQVIDNDLLPTLVKIVKKKTDSPVRERIFLLLDATQTALGGASGKFPQYYTAYHDLVSSGVQFQQQLPRQLRVLPPELPVPKEKTTNLPVTEPLIQKCEDGKKESNGLTVPDFSIIQKAASVLEVLKDVLNALDPKHPEGASDEFVLDLVEQCSFQKQRVMHLVMTSRDEKLVPQAIELNEQLHKILTQHDDLLSVRASSTGASNANEDIDEEEDEECLLRRIRKGKACAEDHSSFRSIPEERMRQPILRPLCIQASEPVNKPSQTASIPPPPAKPTERERFFKEKHTDGPGLNGHMRGLSLHSRNGSSSRSGSTDFSERDTFTYQE